MVAIWTKYLPPWFSLALLIIIISQNLQNLSSLIDNFTQTLIFSLSSLLNFYGLNFISYSYFCQKMKLIWKKSWWPVTYPSFYMCQISFEFIIYCRSKFLYFLLFYLKKIISWSPQFFCCCTFFTIHLNSYFLTSFQIFSIELEFS